MTEKGITKTKDNSLKKINGQIKDAVAIELIFSRDPNCGHPKRCFSLKAEKLTSKVSEIKVAIAAPLMPMVGIRIALPQIFAHAPIS